jgi:hypothetical protein
MRVASLCVCDWSRCHVHVEMGGHAAAGEASCPNSTFTRLPLQEDNKALLTYDHKSLYLRKLFNPCYRAPRKNSCIIASGVAAVVYENGTPTLVPKRAARSAFTNTPRNVTSLAPTVAASWLTSVTAERS